MLHLKPLVAGPRPAQKCSALAENQDLEPGPAMVSENACLVKGLADPLVTGVVIDLGHVKHRIRERGAAAFGSALATLAYGRPFAGTVCAVAPQAACDMTALAAQLGLAANAWYPAPADVADDAALSALLGAEAIKLLLRGDVREVFVVSDVPALAALERFARERDKRLRRVVFSGRALRAEAL